MFRDCGFYSEKFKINNEKREESKPRILEEIKKQGKPSISFEEASAMMEAWYNSKTKKED